MNETSLTTGNNKILPSKNVLVEGFYEKES